MFLQLTLSFILCRTTARLYPTLVRRTLTMMGKEMLVIKMMITMKL